MAAFPPPSAPLAILPGVDCECTHLSRRKKRSQPRPRLCGALFLLSLVLRDFTAFKKKARWAARDAMWDKTMIGESLACFTLAAGAAQRRWG